MSKRPHGDTQPLALLWTANTTFGAYLRRLRTATKLSLRRVAGDLGLSYTYLSKLETGERSAPPSMKLLRRIAVVYGCDLRDILQEAGFSASTTHVTDVTLAERFAALVLDPALRPMRMDERQIEMIPPIVQRQWIEFAEKVRANPQALIDALATAHTNPETL